jgi:hypothetical protein
VHSSEADALDALRQPAAPSDSGEGSPMLCTLDDVARSADVVLPLYQPAPEVEAQARAAWGAKVAGSALSAPAACLATDRVELASALGALRFAPAALISLTLDDFLPPSDEAASLEGLPAFQKLRQWCAPLPPCPCPYPLPCCTCLASSGATNWVNPDAQLAHACSGGRPPPRRAAHGPTSSGACHPPRRLESQGLPTDLTRLAVRAEHSGVLVGAALARGCTEAMHLALATMAGASAAGAVGAAPAAPCTSVVVELVHEDATFFTVPVVGGPRGAVALPPVATSFYDVEDELAAGEHEQERWLAVREVSVRARCVAQRGSLFLLGAFGDPV